ncbi:MAG: hypothetical protein K0S24_3149 [Sphingobacterium sp.]|jgi:hypothetical protein|nr:hypothetical protein [Sphingobacterium sp.]
MVTLDVAVTFILHILKKSHQIMGDKCAHFLRDTFGGTSSLGVFLFFIIAFGNSNYAIFLYKHRPGSTGCRSPLSTFRFNLFTKNPKDG